MRREGKEGRRCRSREGRKKERNRAGRGGSEDRAKRDTHIFRELCESPYQMSGTGTTPGQLTEMGRKCIILREDRSPVPSTLDFKSLEDSYDNLGQKDVLRSYW